MVGDVLRRCAADGSCAEAAGDILAVDRPKPWSILAITFLSLAWEMMPSIALGANCFSSSRRSLRHSFLTVKLFQQFPDVLEKYRRRFRYIMVDEYQDTNHAQYLLVSLLAGGHQNLCVVGDCGRRRSGRWRR